MSDIIRHMFERARRFRSAVSGNVIVIFSLALVPLLLGVGASVDYTRASTTRTALQQAADSAALAAAATGLTNNTALTVVARNFF